MAVPRLQLLPGEQVLIDVRPHWSFITGPLVVSLVVIAVGVTLDVGVPHTSVRLHWVEGLVVAVPCVWLLVRVVQWRTTRLVLTPFRIIELWGVVSRHRSETRLAEIVTVVAVQSLPRRIMGTGRLELELRGEDEVRWLDDVRKPDVLRRVINRRLQPHPGPGTPAGY
ncbi:MAG: PH domain-containing protein [Acidimicrobiales bacterium]